MQETGAMMSKRVALVLGSGGARGYAHIGVIEELRARGYEIGCIAGCSMGAVIGGLYASGHLREYREWIEGLDYMAVLRLVDLSFSMGAMRGDRVFGKIHEMIGERNIEDLPIPYTAVATDLTNQQEVWFQEGSLQQAMRASAAIPSLFTPVMHGDRMLVDGGLLNPLPIVPVVASHCDLVVAVNLNAIGPSLYQLPEVERDHPVRRRLDGLLESLGERLPFLRREDQEELFEPLPEPPLEKDAPPKSAGGSRVLDATGPASLLNLINQSFEVMQNSLTQYKIAGYPPDILIEVPKRICRFFEFYRGKDLIQVGRQIAADTLDRYEGRA